MENNKKIILIITTIIIISSSINVNAYPQINKQEINKTYLFNEPMLNKIEINQTLYDQIIMKNTINIGDPGEPKLPVYESRLLLPQNTKVQEPGRQTESVMV